MLSIHAQYNFDPWNDVSDGTAMAEEVEAEKGFRLIPRSTQGVHLVLRLNPEPAVGARLVLRLNVGSTRGVRRVLRLNPEPPPPLGGPWPAIRPACGRALTLGAMPEPLNVALFGATSAVAQAVAREYAARGARLALVGRPKTDHKFDDAHKVPPVKKLRGQRSWFK